MKSMLGTKGKRSVLTVKPAETRHEEKRTYVIIGVERGGTSMVAGVVRALGVNMGERAGLNHEDPKFLSDDEEKLLAQIDINNSESDVWGFKIPKASIMLDFYNASLRNPYYIVVFRNIAATVDSWCTRGENDPYETGKHAIKYYLKSLEDLQNASRPTLFVNYERACQDPESFINALSDFLGVELNEALLSRASGMVTGDGGGYLDLPEFYFYINELDRRSKLSEFLKIKYAPGSVGLNKLSSKSIADRIIVLTEDGEYFPEKFYLTFNLKAKESMTFDECKIRIYMDFTGEFSPKFARRPSLIQGKNLLLIETNGKVKRIAIGGFENDIEYSVGDVSAFLQADDVVRRESRLNDGFIGNILRKIRRHKS